MSVDFYFYQRNQTKQLSPDFVKEKLSSEFKITNLAIDELTGLVRYFKILPKTKEYGPMSEIEMSFSWQDLTTDPEHAEEVRARGGTLYRYMNITGYGASKDDLRPFRLKYQARVAKLLEMVIDDPQRGLDNLSPEVFSSEESLNQAYLEKEKSRQSQSTKNQSSKDNLGVTNKLLDRRGRTILAYLLLACFYIFIFVNKSLSDLELKNYINRGVDILLLYGIFHLLFYGFKALRAKTTLREINKNLKDSPFTSKDLNNLLGKETMASLNVKVFTLKGIINFILITILLISSSYVINTFKSH